MHLGVGGSRTSAEEEGEDDAEGYGVADADGDTEGSSILFHTGVALHVTLDGAGGVGGVDPDVDALGVAEGVTAHVGVVDSGAGAGDGDSVCPRVGVVLGAGSHVPYAVWHPTAQ